MFCEAAHGDSSDLRELMREAREIAELNGNRVWPRFSDAPFGILLVEKEEERLFCHEGPAREFEPLGVDPVLSCVSHYRSATFPPNLLASFPAVDGIATIVIGTPEATGKTPREWILTLLHEHFHQLQFSWPNYYPGIESLTLSGGDDTGMWMLNYPFPYRRAETSSAFRLLADRLVVAMNARGTDSFDEAILRYWQAREAARDTVTAADWKYVELQFWQEGVARWTEGAIAALTEGYVDAASEAERRILQELAELDLAQQGRLAVYPIGAGEAMLLDAAGPDWREQYWSEPFALGPQLKRLATSRIETSENRMPHSTVPDR